MKNAINPSLSATTGRGWIENLALSQRRKLFDAFVQFRQGDVAETVLELDLSAEAINSSGSSGAYVEPDNLRTWSDVQQKSVVTSHAVDPAMPGLRLPYPDGSFDWVFCSEVIEHAGTQQAQQSLVAECYRVARKGIFIATPNRGHPIEFNSALPFVHWLAQPWRRRILDLTGRGRWADLALLDARRLYTLAEALPGAPAHDVGHKRVFGIKAHFFLMISKSA